jgi:O-antigen ligase
MRYTTAVLEILQSRPTLGTHPIHRWIGRGATLAALLLIALALAWLPLRLLLLLSAGSAALLLLLWRPWLAWLGLGALVPFAAAIDVGPASVLDLLLAGALALWFLDGVRRDELRLYPSPPLAAAALFVLFLLLNSMRALDFAQALAEVIKWAEFAVVLAIAPVMLRALPATQPQQAIGGRVRWVALGLVAGAAAQAALGIYQFVFRIGPDWFVILGRFMRASGSFGQPNPFAGYLGLVLPVAASLAIWSWAEVARSRRSAPQANGRCALLWALVWSAGAAIISAGILASWSRGAWLGAAAAAVTIVVLRSRRAAILAALAALLLGSALLVGVLSPAAVQERVPESVRTRLAEIPAFFGAGDILAQEVTDENFAVVERVAHWVAAQRMFEAAPWLGVGAGSYAAAYPSFRLPVWEEALGHAHNAYLNSLAEVGIVGSAAFALLWVTLIIWMARRLQSARRDGAPPAARESAALIIGLFGVLAHLAVHSIVDNLFVQGIYIALALWAALVATPVSSPTSGAPSARNSL